MYFLMFLRMVLAFGLSLGDGPASDGILVVLFGVIAIPVMGGIVGIALAYKYAGKKYGHILLALVIASIIFTLTVEYSEISAINKKVVSEKIDELSAQLCSKSPSQFSKSYSEFLQEYIKTAKKDRKNKNYKAIFSCIEKSDLYKEDSFTRASYEYLVLHDMDKTLDTLYKAMVEGDETAAWRYYDFTNDGCFFYHRDYQVNTPFQDFCKKLSPENISNHADLAKINKCLTSYKNNWECNPSKYTFAFFRDETAKTAPLKLKIVEKEESVPYSMASGEFTVVGGLMTDEKGYGYFNYRRGDKFYKFRVPTEHINTVEDIIVPVIEINLNEVNPS